MASKNEARIKFTAETAEFTQTIKEANSDMSSLRAEMKLNEAQFQNTGDSAEYLKTKQELLESQLEANRDKQEALTGKLEVAKSIYGENSEEVSKLERQLTYAQTEEQQLLTDVNNLSDGLNEQEEATDNAGESVASMSEILVNAGIANMIKEIGEAAVEMAENFDEAGAAIVEGTGASDEALDGLNESARNAFAQIADSDADLADVSSILAELNTRFAVTGDKATDLTTKIANFAQHTGTDGVKAVDSIADVTKRWNLNVSDIEPLLDDLTTANQSCQLSVDELSGYLVENSTQFQELGYNTQESLAMLISLSDGGANVSSIMSGMKKAVSNLSEVTNDVPGTFQQAIKAISDCGSVSEALQTKVGNTGKTVEEIFGAKAAQELATNVQNGSFAIEDWTKVLDENSGALDETTENATTMEDAWSQATNNVSMALSSTFAPAISDVVKQVSDVITKISQVIQQSPVLQAVLTSVAVALSILAVTLGISSLITAVQKAFSLLNTTMLANPIFIVVTVLAALAAGLVYAYKHCEKFREIVDKVFSAVGDFIKNTWESIKTSFTSALSSISNFVSNSFNAIKTTFTTVWNAISNFVLTVWNGIKNTITTVITAIKNTISTVFNAIKTVITTVFNVVKTFIGNVWNGIKTVISTVVNVIKTTISTVFNAVKNTISSIFNGIKNVATTVWNGIKTAIFTPISKAKELVGSIVDGIKSKVTGVFDSVKTTVSKVWNGIKSAITKPLEKARDVVKNIIDKIKGFFSFKISWPHIPTPHFSVTPSGWKVGDLLKGSIPKLGISWYAKGAVFDSPTIFPTAYGLKGVGENGPEAVAPVSILQNYVTEAVERADVQDINYDLLANKVARACSKMNISIDVDSRELGRVIRGYT